MKPILYTNEVILIERTIRLMDKKINASPRTEPLFSMYLEVGELLRNILNKYSIVYSGKEVEHDNSTRISDNA